MKLKSLKVIAATLHCNVIQQHFKIFRDIFHSHFHLRLKHFKIIFLRFRYQPMFPLLKQLHHVLECMIVAITQFNMSYVRAGLEFAKYNNSENLFLSLTNFQPKKRRK